MGGADHVQLAISCHELTNRRGQTLATSLELTNLDLQCEGVPLSQKTDGDMFNWVLILRGVAKHMSSFLC